MTSESNRIPELDRKGLREFALVTGGVIAGLFGLVLPWLFDLGWPRWPWILAGILIAVGLIVPVALRPVYKTWMRFGLILNRITTPVIMGLVFFFVITPTGLVRRLLSEDPMARNPSDKESYRIPRKKPPPKNIERPF